MDNIKLYARNEQATDSLIHITRIYSNDIRIILSLYTKCNEGGRGLVSVRTVVQDKTTKIQEYIRKMAPKELLSEYLRQQKANDEKDEPSRMDQPLCGMYHQQIEEVADIKKYYQ
ncbi:uncharacterized protein AKAME5_002378800 [Lates japonicus]|uniref:Uncharacterized protein n=1 Tax=Lates japonicus TaxID=270547 RepID=A0AAD3NG91_LATJO|nr:uncharacterized protein AKAME5_002378800 [Lates japonicus]